MFVSARNASPVGNSIFWLRLMRDVQDPLEMRVRSYVGVSGPIGEECEMINKDQIEGKAKGVTGKIEKEAGNQKLEEKGVKRELEGKVQEHIGKLKDAVKDARKF
jgi:uncharacterized protein YjbJ (UPF0337 family)